MQDSNIVLQVVKIENTNRKSATHFALCSGLHLRYLIDLDGGAKRLSENISTYSKKLSLLMQFINIIPFPILNLMKLGYFVKAELNKEVETCRQNIQKKHWNMIVGTYDEKQKIVLQCFNASENADFIKIGNAATEKEMNAEISFLQQKRVYSTFDIPQLLGSISRADGATFNIQITNGRVVIPVQELLDGKRMYKNFYIPKPQTEFTYVLVKKILKKVFSDGSKQRLTALWKAMNEKERQETKAGLKRFIAEDQINEILECVDSLQYDLIDLERAHQLLKKKTSNVADNLHYKVFDLKRRFERIVHPTGLFIVLLGVDGAGKTTIAENLKARYVTAFRKIDHYHSRVRVLKDISQLKKDATPIDASNPHGKKQKAGKFTSVAKFGYYFLDFLIGNVKIAIAKIKSTLVLVERYYYDYSIDKVRYNLNLSDKFLLFFEHFVLKPDVIFILTGDSKKLLDRKHEITIDEIDEQKRKLNERFINNPKAVFIDTTEGTVDECVNKMLKECNAIMRKRRKW